MIFTNQLETQRIEKCDELRKCGINPYPHYIKKQMSIKNFREKYSFILENPEKKDESINAILSGRIKLLRNAGKAVFANIEDESGSLQIYFNKNALGEEYFEQVRKYIEVGDIILVKGYPFVTKTGEFSIHLKELKLVSKSIIPLPEKFHGLTDIELRYRQRYLDMIMNPQVRQTFKARSQIVSTMRKFFEQKGFLEVETPMMHEIAGGANAKPFITHHNALGIDRYLRIAPELFLKRLIVGGFEAVFEMNRNFRNEGMDLTHNPEFSMLEFYWAYHDYHDLMSLTEELINTLRESLNLDETIEYDGEKINLKAPFAKIPYKKALVEIGKLDEKILKDKNAILEKLKNDGFEANSNLSLGHLHAELFDNYVEDKLINPTFITHYPIEISPLSRRSDEDPNIAERFEFFIAGREIANGFNELNDPLDQYARFQKQIQAKNEGDEEAHEMDEDYVRALGYAMPPTAGQGIGIDRLVMLFTNNTSIRDVILFPAMKPIKKKEDNE